MEQQVQENHLLIKSGRTDGLPSPLPSLLVPGGTVLPWEEWYQTFKLYLNVMEVMSDERQCTLLVNCLGNSDQMKYTLIRHHRVAIPVCTEPERKIARLNDRYGSRILPSRKGWNTDT